MSSRYVELHAASAFSFLQGASLPEELIGRAAELELSAIALLDADGVYGAPRFYQAGKKAGVTAHVGAEVTGPDGARYPLLVETREGYQHLCQLLTRMKLRSRKGEGAVTREELEEHAAGLVCLTGGSDGPLHHALRHGGKRAARRCLEELQGTFGQQQVYAELQRGHTRRESARNEAVTELAASLQVPLLATNGVRHAHPIQRRLLDVLTCIRHGTTLGQAGRLLAPNAHRHLRSGAEMEALFSDLPAAIAHTEDLSGRLQFTLKDLGYEFPRYPVPAGETMDSFLAQQADWGARERYRPYYEKARHQIERELKLIAHLGLAGYFLIVWDLVQFCRQQGILVQGRGSAANSAVCYALGITAVDPVGMELLFERFLSEERGEWPDIDLDLPSGERREQVIQHVYRRYGERGAAMTANVITYRSRSAAREVGKVLGFGAEVQARLSHASRGWEWTDPADTTIRRFGEAGLDVSRPEVRHYWDLFCAIQDLPRHLGQHSGGMIVCEGQLDSIVPLEPASMPGRVVVQWDKDDCADLGLMKIDLLGLGMMAVLEDCLTLVPAFYGEPLDLAHLPQEPAVYDTLCAADTVGLFQIESRAQMATLPRIQPRCFYDLVIEVAIIRPGPVVGKMVHPYIQRRRGLEPIVPLHPLLKPVLARTLGLPLFQEQLLRMSMVVAGFTGGQAEGLRRALGHKRSERRMQEVEAQLREGMTRKGIDKPTQEAVVQSITSFALYGFPESHAASFALLAYASAYLKWRYLPAFTCAMLNNQPMGFYHPSTLVKDAQRHGLRFLPIDVNRSDTQCTLEQHGDGLLLRLGLNYVRGLRREAAAAIVAERQQKGVYAHVEEVVRRVPTLRKDEARQLATVGAFHTAGTRHRRDALWQVEAAIRPLGPLLDQVAESDDECPLTPLTETERMMADYQGTGVNLGAHPMAKLRKQLTGLRLTRSDKLARLRHGQAVTLAGAVIVRQRPGTANGFFFLSLEDESGITNVIVSPQLYDQERAVWTGASFLLVDGSLQIQQGVVSVKAGRVRPLLLRGLALQSHDFH